MRPFLLTCLVAIAISSNAQPYCTLPANYYNGLSGLSCNALKAALYNKISAGYVEQANTSLWANFQKTDKRRNDANTKDIVWDIYTDKPNATGECEFTFVTDQDNGTQGNAECQKYNREHTMPQSWFASAAPMVTDLFEVYPTDKYVNAQHDNFPYGEVNPGGSGVTTYNNGSRRGPSAIAGITGTVFEPIDEYKGDVARSYLYMATRYHNVVAGWDKLDPSGDKALDGKQYPAFEIAYLKLLLKWHHQDPVSQKEIARNNAIYCIQQNRNPYIDMPELVDLVWNPTCAGAETLPVDLILFKGLLSGENVLLSWDAANESNFKNYTIERSTDGRQFDAISIVPATHAAHYNYPDNIASLPVERVYYRLRMTDRDGAYRYSEIIHVTLPSNTLFTVYPNPATTGINIRLSKTVVKAAIEITDMAGRVQVRQAVDHAAGNINIPVSKLLPGNYIVTVLFDGQKKSGRITISR